jgi:hypothetical protein
MHRVGIVILGLILLSGCAPATTETGYEPRHLGMSDGQRRGLYAPKFSPEQAQAQAEHEQEAKRKPSSNFGAGGPSY